MKERTIEAGNLPIETGVMGRGRGEKILERRVDSSGINFILEINDERK